jgi:hypothetical protein
MTSILCIDVRNGRTIYQAADYEPRLATSLHQIVGDAKNKTVKLVTTANTTTLTFTDKPWAPGPSSPASSQSVRDK